MISTTLLKQIQCNIWYSSPQHCDLIGLRTDNIIPYLSISPWMNDLWRLGNRKKFTSLLLLVAPSLVQQMHFLQNYKDKWSFFNAWLSYCGNTRFQKGFINLSGKILSEKKFDIWYYAPWNIFTLNIQKWESWGSGKGNGIMGYPTKAKLQSVKTKYYNQVCQWYILVFATAFLQLRYALCKARPLNYRKLICNDSAMQSWNV